VVQMINIQIAAEPKPGVIPWDAVIALGPHVLWILFAAGVLLWFGRPRLVELLTRVQKLSVAGVEVELRQTLQQAANAKGEELPSASLDLAARRLAASTSLLKGARLLWIDDQPDNNRFEHTLFEEAGAKIHEAVSDQEAEGRLKRAKYDLILSDISRGGDGAAGTKFLAKLVADGQKAPVIFYVGSVSGPAPNGAFGITDSPDELVHLVLDAMSRRRS
jgi:CheY-like chemotaxis protein